MEKVSPSPDIPSKTKVEIGPKKVYYFEDDYFEVTSENYYHLKCDRSAQPVPQPPFPFNYSRFSDYLRVKSRIEFLNRMVGATNPDMKYISPGLEYYTDDKLKEELFDIYGELEESSERFRLIFANYKEQRLEQVQQWIEMQKETCSSNKPLFGYVFVDEADELAHHFSAEELELFRSVEGKGGSEPFLLPRKPDQANANAVSKRVHKEEVHSEAYRILQNHPLGLTRDIFLKKLDDKARHNKNKTGKRVSKLTSSQLIENEELSKDILFKTSYPLGGGYLVFPACMQPVVHQNPMSILWNLKHKLVAMLNLAYGIIEVNKCVDLCMNVFQIKRFHPTDWGFPTNVEFVKWMADKWKSENVEVIKLTGENEQNTLAYLTVMTDERRHLVETKFPPGLNNLKAWGSGNDPNSSTIASKSQKNGAMASGLPVTRALSSTNSTSLVSPSPVSPPPPKIPPGPWGTKPDPNELRVSSLQPPLLNYDPSIISIPPQYVQPGQKIVQEQNEISPGTTTNCVVSLVNSPTNVYLVRQTKWKDLERLFRELQDSWNPLALSPHPKFLQQNYICMARPNPEVNEVYRVAILGRVDLDHYQVVCIDYGDIFKVHHHHLRYLPRDFLTVLDAQVISCSIYNVASPSKDTKGSDVWTNDVIKYTKSLFNPDDRDIPLVKVKFMERMQSTRKWLVKVGLPSKSDDFGEEIMKFVNKKR